MSASRAGLKVKTARYLLRSSLKTLGALGANGNFNIFLSLTQKKKGAHLGSFKDPTWSCDQTHTLCSRWLHWKIKKKKNKLVNSLIFCQCLRKINFLFISIGWTKRESVLNTGLLFCVIRLFMTISQNIVKSWIPTSEWHWNITSRMCFCLPFPHWSGYRARLLLLRAGR